MGRQRQGLGLVVGEALADRLRVAGHGAVGLGDAPSPQVDIERVEVLAQHGTGVAHCRCRTRTRVSARGFSLPRAGMQKSASKA